MKDEQLRRIKELSELSEEEIEQRVAVSNILVGVQKELLATRKPAKVRRRRRRRRKREKDRVGKGGVGGGGGGRGGI